MTLPANITTAATWPRHKNAIIGPFQATARGIATENTQAEFQVLFAGSASTSHVAQSFRVASNETVDQVVLLLARFNNPTDNLVVEIRPDVSGAPGDTSTILTSGTLSGSSLQTTDTWNAVSLTPVALSSSTTYWLVAHRSGAIDATTSYYWRSTVWNSLGSTYANGNRANGNGTTWTQTIDEDHAFSILRSTTSDGLYVFLCDETNNKVRAYRSVDGGHTWAERDAANAPTLVSTNSLRSLTVGASSPNLQVVYPTATDTLEFTTFSMDAAAWGRARTGPSSGQSGSTGTNVSGTHTVQGGLRSDGQLILTWQGPTENVMATAYRRMKLAKKDMPNQGAWASTLDIISGTTAAPGTQAHYDLRAAVFGSGGRFHIVWTQSDSTQIKQRRYNLDNTFGTIVGFGAISNTAAYPLGVPCTYTDGADTKIAFPYVDSTTTKVARCISGSDDVAGNWTTETAVALASEVTSANPGCLFSDGAASKKLWLWRVTGDAGRDIFYTDDGGAATWMAETPWKDGTVVTCDGISARPITDAIGVCYLDSSTTPARVRYDRLIVFRSKASQSVGTITKTYDLGVAGPHDVSVLLDVGSGADITGQVDVTVSWSADGQTWEPISQASCYAAQLRDVIALSGAPRYVQVSSVVSGAAADVGADAA